MLKFLRNLFGTDTANSSEAQPKGERQDVESVSITPMVEDAAVTIYEQEKGRATTDREKAAIRESVRQTEAEPYEPSDYDPREDPELAAMMREDDIKNAASAMRVVVVSYVDLLSHPLFSRMKRDLPAIRQSHEEVLQHWGKDYFKEAVAYAHADMFSGDFQIIENTDNYKAFLADYTANPKTLDLAKLRDLIDEEDRQTWGEEIDRLFGAQY